MSGGIGKKGLFAGIVLAGLLAAFASAAVFAQTGEETDPRQERRVQTQQHWDSFLERVAAQLGRSVDELRAAITGAQQELLDEGVAQGRLSEEAADRMRERLQSGPHGFFGAPFHGPFRGGPRHAAPLRGFGTVELHSEELATFLGLTVDELRAAMREGSSLAQVAEAQGKSRAELTQFLVDQARARAQAAVDAGRLTQEQADALVERLEAHVDRMIDAQRVHKSLQRPGSGQSREGLRFSAPRVLPRGEAA